MSLQNPAQLPKSVLPLDYNDPSTAPAHERLRGVALIVLVLCTVDVAELASEYLASGLRISVMKSTFGPTLGVMLFVQYNTLVAMNVIGWFGALFYLLHRRNPVRIIKIWAWAELACYALRVPLDLWDTIHRYPGSAVQASARITYYLSHTVHYALVPLLILLMLRRRAADHSPAERDSIENRGT